jgi:hypothetical protein
MAPSPLLSNQTPEVLNPRGIPHDNPRCLDVQVAPAALNGLSPGSSNANRGFKLMKSARVTAPLSMTRATRCAAARMPHAGDAGARGDVSMKNRLEMHNGCG